MIDSGGAERLPGEEDAAARPQGLFMGTRTGKSGDAAGLALLAYGGSTNDSVCPEGSAASFPPGLGC